MRAIFYEQSLKEQKVFFRQKQQEQVNKINDKQKEILPSTLLCWILSWNLIKNFCTNLQQVFENVDFSVLMFLLTKLWT